jgi:hypothetical protein
VRAAYALRGAIRPLADRETRRHAATIDRATVDMVAERGPLRAGLRPGDAAADAAARPYGR